MRAVENNYVKILGAHLTLQRVTWCLPFDPTYQCLRVSVSGSSGGGFHVDGVARSWLETAGASVMIVCLFFCTETTCIQDAIPKQTMRMPNFM